MTWQKVVRHVSDQRIVVRSKSGNEYPVDTERDRLGESVYSHEVNEANDWDLWAWVDFDDDDFDGPVAKDISTGNPQGGPPDAPPWERGR